MACSDRGSGPDVRASHALWSELAQYATPSRLGSNRRSAGDGRRAVAPTLRGPPSRVIGMQLSGSMWSVTCTATAEGPRRARATAPTRSSASATSSSSSTTPTTRAASSPTCSAPRTPTRLVELRTARRFEEARELGAPALGGSSTEAIRDREAPSASSTPNSSPPSPHRRTPPTATSTCRALWPEYAGPGTTVLDGERAEIGGRRLRLRRRRPAHADAHARTRSATRSTRPRSRRSARSTCCARTSRRTSPSSCYDTVARRFERGSRALLAAIHRTRPRYALFGHVHQPLARRMRIGATECVNVGHFAGVGHGRGPWSGDARSPLRAR